MFKLVLIVLLSASCGLQPMKRNEKRLMSSMRDDVSSVGEYYCYDKGGLKSFKFGVCEKGKKCKFSYTCNNQ